MSNNWWHIKLKNKERKNLKIKHQICKYLFYCVVCRKSYLTFSPFKTPIFVITSQVIVYCRTIMHWFLVLYPLLTTWLPCLPSICVYDNALLSTIQILNFLNWIFYKWTIFYIFMMSMPKHFIHTQNNVNWYLAREAIQHPQQLHMSQLDVHMQLAPDLE